MRRKIGSFFIILIMILAILCNTSVVRAEIRKAEVGSFESYDSGSSWSSGDWGSSSSSGDILDSIFGIFGLLGGLVELVFLVIIWIIVELYFKRKGKRDSKNPYYPNDVYNYESRQPKPATPNTLREEETLRKIQEVDEMFRKEEFIAWSKNLFVKLQQAWTDRNWETIRTFETNELFEQHKNQLQGYINNNQINVLDRICVNFANLYDFRQEGDKDILVVRLNSRMADYIINATTKQVINGDKNIERTYTYLLTFVRESGIKTKESSSEIKITNCPNCGAPTKITSSGKCEYCGSVITIENQDWVLSKLLKSRI